MKPEDREMIEVELHGKKQKVFKGEISMLKKLGKIKERKTSGQTKERKK